MQEKAKGALIRSRFTTLRDMDAPTSFFFNLERRAGQSKQMMSLKSVDGQETSDPVEMRRWAVRFYTELYAAEGSDPQCTAELLQHLPSLSEEQRDTLDSGFTLEEVVKAVQQLSSGRAPGIDGLPSDFYKTLWGIIGTDFYEVLQEWLREKVPPQELSACRSYSPPKERRPLFT